MSHVFHTLKLCTRQLLMRGRGLQTGSDYVLRRGGHILTRRWTLPRLERISCKRYITEEDVLDDTHPLELRVDDLSTDLDDKFNLRRFLYPKDVDDIMEQITNSTAVQDIFNVIKDYQDLKHYHVCQSVLTLWDLQKAYSDCYVLNLDKLDVNYSVEKMLKDYISMIKCHPEFQKLLSLTQEHANSFNALELSCVIFNLKKMGHSLDDPVLEQLINLAYESIKSDISKWCLRSLSFYTAVFDPKDYLRCIYLTKDLLPFYLKAIETHNSPEDFECITVALHNLHFLISRSFVNKYIDKLKEILSSSNLTPDHIKMLTKALIFLNLPHWSRNNSEHVVYLSSFFKDHVKSLNATDLITLHKSVHLQNSPGYLRDCITERAKYFLEQSKSDDRISTFTQLPDLMFCQITGTGMTSKSAFEKMIKECIHQSFPNMLITLYKLLRFLKYSNVHMNDQFWNKVQQSSMSENIPDYILLRLVYRYLYFNHNLGSIYRNDSFEKAIIQKCISSQDELLYLIPKKMSKVAAFLIGYGFDARHSVDMSILCKFIRSIEDVKDQLDTLDWLCITRGLYVSQVTANRYNENGRLLLAHVGRMVNEASMKFMNSDNGSIDHLCCYLKIFQYRQTRFDTEEYLKLLYKLERSDEYLSANCLRELMINLFLSGIILPKLYNRITDCVAEKGENLFGEIVTKIIHTFSFLGYTPKRNEFFNKVIEVIERDKNVLNCLTLLQVCSALCYFEHLPEKLVKYIFTIEFMERIDKEIDTCYSKAQYPSKIRQKLMQLNRAVCLELPQYDIPWFHEKYVASRQILTPRSRSVVYDDVLNTLVKVLGSKNAVKFQHFTPYGYKIDFFAQLDEKNRPIMQTSTSEKDVTKTKIAISLINSKTFSKYCSITETSTAPFKIKLVPNGILLSRRRHLELMGYKIIDIHPSVWNSMHMAEPNEKYKYLHKHIFNTS